MERQVAQLVSRGMSNKDTAAQCRVSPRTVAFHPRNIFTKAWVTSRGELTQLDPTYSGRLPQLGASRGSARTRLARRPK
ncbi:MAG: helix-turn-helix domain-containing protein [Actinomycetes bacterium]